MSDPPRETRQQKRGSLARTLPEGRSKLLGPDGIRQDPTREGPPPEGPPCPPQAPEPPARLSGWDAEGRHVGCGGEVRQASSPGIPRRFCVDCNAEWVRLNGGWQLIGAR